MSPQRILIALVIGALLTWGTITARSPYRTALPFGTTDLSSIQGKLNKLPAAERELVLAYVKRSKGDVLPPKLADPDEPFTARTVGEAIELQRKFLVKQAGRDAVAQSRAAARDDAFAPLRAALDIDLVKRELIWRDQASGSQQHSTSSDDAKVLVTTYRLQNTSDTRIVSFKASVKIRKRHRSETELGILNDCYIERDEVLDPGQTLEVRCGDLRAQVSEEGRRYAEMPGSELLIEWEPRLIRFSNGRELEFRD